MDFLSELPAYPNPPPCSTKARLREPSEGTTIYGHEVPSLLVEYWRAEQSGDVGHGW